jgi:MFS family permease
VGEFLSIVAAAEFSGMLCAFLGPLFDSLGPRTMLVVGQFLNFAGLALPIFSRSYWPVFAGWLLFETAYNIIAPSIQAAMSLAINDPTKVRYPFLQHSVFIILTIQFNH